MPGPQGATPAELAESIAALYQALEARDKAVTAPYHPPLVASEHPQGSDALLLSGLFCFTFARHHEKLQELAAAERLYGRALDAREKHLPPDHLDVILTLLRLASVCLAQGKEMEARDYLGRIPPEAV